MRGGERAGSLLMNAILVFVAITYALSIALSLVVGLTGGQQSPFIGLGYLAMFFPAVAVVVVRFAMHDGLLLDWSRFPLTYLPLALLLIPAVLHAAMLPALAALEVRVPWQDWLSPGADGLYHAPEQRGWAC